MGIRQKTCKLLNCSLDCTYTKNIGSRKHVSPRHLTILPQSYFLLSQTMNIACVAGVIGEGVGEREEVKRKRGPVPSFLSLILSHIPSPRLDLLRSIFFSLSLPLPDYGCHPLNYLDKTYYCSGRSRGKGKGGGGGVMVKITHQIFVICDGQWTMPVSKHNYEQHLMFYDKHKRIPN